MKTTHALLTLDQAEDIAARTLAALDGHDHHSCLDCLDVQDYARERVASDLAGLRDHPPVPYPVPAGRPAPLRCAGCDPDTHAADWPCPDAARYAEGLLHTAALYGVKP